MFRIFNNEKQRFDQWSVDQKLICEGLKDGTIVYICNDITTNTPLKVEVHTSNIPDPSNVSNNLLLCDVPNILLTTNNNIYVSLNGFDWFPGFEVDPCVKPANYVYKPTVLYDDDQPIAIRYGGRDDGEIATHIVYVKKGSFIQIDETHTLWETWSYFWREIALVVDPTELATKSSFQTTYTEYIKPLLDGKILCPDGNSLLFTFNAQHIQGSVSMSLAANGAVLTYDALSIRGYFRAICNNNINMVMSTTYESYLYGAGTNGKPYTLKQMLMTDQPTQDMHIATKKYIDDAIEALRAELTSSI